MQEGFRYPESELIVPKILDEVNSGKYVNIFTKFVDVSGSNFETQLKWTKFQDESNQRVMKEFNNADKNVFEHNSYTAITSEVLDFFNSNSIKKVYLCGIYTDVSVLKSAMDLFDAKYEVFVLKDCCASIHKNQNFDLHQSGLESISHIIGKDHII